MQDNNDHNSANIYKNDVPSSSSQTVFVHDSNEVFMAEKPDNSRHRLKIIKSRRHEQRLLRRTFLRIEAETQQEDLHSSLEAMQLADRKELEKKLSEAENAKLVKDAVQAYNTEFMLSIRPPEVVAHDLSVEDRCHPSDATGLFIQKVERSLEMHKANVNYHQDFTPGQKFVFHELSTLTDEEKKDINVKETVKELFEESK